LKAAWEKLQTHKGIPIKVTAGLSIETLQAKREWQDILKVIKEKKKQNKKNYNQDYSTQQGSHSDIKEKSKALQASKS